MRHFLLIATLLTATPAIGQGLDSMTLANELGSVLAAEEFCGLSYDQAAIAAFIEAKVDAADMSFPSLLGGMTDGHRHQQDAMTASAKTAHCTQIGRIAASYGFAS